MARRHQEVWRPSWDFHLDAILPWLYPNGPKGPDIFAMTAWFRYWLMGDTAQRKYFFSSDCTLCTDSRLDVWRNALLTQ